ncbi:MAG: GNAT family N-acetyltransferase [Nitrosarchaeum sp.]|nr:GNAT family N-acetyltransferase [Nitrosarchaeum sp.]
MSGIIIRKLQKEDLQNGFLSTLDSLRKASNMNKKTAEKIFDKINSNSDHIIIVAVMDGRIVGSTTLLIETKFIHNGGKVGHIEDVVIDKDHQRKDIGEKIIKYLLKYAKDNGCYKTILDCVDDVKPFYEKLGFKHNANALRFDHV